MFGGALIQGKFDSYQHSRLAQKTLQKRFWSIVDLDGTFAAGDPAIRHKVRARLESMGAFLFSTARTPELVMSRRSFELSKALAGFTRSEPRWLGSDGVYYENPLDTLPPEEQDPDAILSFGQGIYIGGIGCELKKCNPYFVDTDYRDKYLDPVGPDGSLLGGKPWIELAHDLVHELKLEGNLAAINCKGARDNANVDEPDFRLQLDFSGANAIEQKYKALSLLHATPKGPLAGRFEGVDESKPSDNPEESRATLYGMEPRGRKENMINYALSRTCRPLGIDMSQMSGLIIGDTLTDFYAACYAGWDADFTGLIVGGSRLSKCIEEKVNFAGVDLRHMHSALIPTDRAGFYKFINPLSRGGWMKKGPTRCVILGEQAYPGTVGAETILAYLEDRQKKQASAH